MTLEELKLRRLAGQYLLEPGDTQTAVKNLCGLQAQFLGHALHGLSIRSNAVRTEGLVKSWTIRGTMHLFSIDDLPLFLHEGRNHFLRPVDTLESDAYISAARKSFFADLIVDAVSQGIEEREALKIMCGKAGMTESESQSIFNPWGGTIRALCETGRICHKVQEKKAYQLCPPFKPMEAEAAQLELARRYFTHFGPAAIKDAACFFGTTQTKVKTWLKQLPVTETIFDGKSYFFIDAQVAVCELPECLFLAGFDQLMLGYEKRENLFLPEEHMRDIFNLAGIVRPAILVDGEVVGWWNMKNRRLSISLFHSDYVDLIEGSARKQWQDIKRIDFL